MSKYKINEEEWEKLHKEEGDKVNRNVQIFLEHTCNFWVTITKEENFENVFVSFEAAKEHAIKNNYLLYGVRIRYNKKEEEFEAVMVSRLNNKKELEPVYTRNKILDRNKESVKEVCYEKLYQKDDRR